MARNIQTVKIVNDWKESLIQDYLAGVTMSGEDGLFKKYRRDGRIVRKILKEAGIFQGRRSPAQLRAWKKRTGRPHPTHVERSIGITTHPTSTQWAYIAGIFDGEGSLSSNSRQIKRGSPIYVIDITQKDVKLLYWIREVLSVGNVSLRKDGKPSAWRLQQTKGIYDFLYHVHPYLIVKRANAERVLTYFATRYGWEDVDHDNNQMIIVHPLPYLKHRFFLMHRFLIHRNEVHNGNK